MVLAWWLVRRLGAATVRSPIPLTALVALSLSLRLVFEENLRDSYYFMALAVALLLLDVVCGRIRGPVLAWLALVTLAHDVWPLNMFGAVSWGFGATEHLPQILIVVGIVIVLVDVARARVHWYRVAWLLVTVAAFATWPFTDEPFRTPLPKWFWQLVLVSIGMWLAAGPLVRFMRDRDAHPAGDATPPHGVIGSAGVPHDGHVGAGVNASIGRSRPTDGAADTDFPGRRPRPEARPRLMEMMTSRSSRTSMLPRRSSHGSRDHSRGGGALSDGASRRGPSSAWSSSSAGYSPVIPSSPPTRPGPSRMGTCRACTHRTRRRSRPMPHPSIPCSLRGSRPSRR